MWVRFRHGDEWLGLGSMVRVRNKFLRLRGLGLGLAYLPPAQHRLLGLTPQGIPSLASQG